MSKLTLQINNVPGYSGTITIDADERGKPLDRFWRRRLADAKIDNCVEVVRPASKAQPAAPKTTKQEPEQ